MGLLRLFAILLLVLAVALIVFDAAISLKGGRFLMTSFEKFWQLAGGERLFGLRPTLSGAFGSAGDFVADAPAAILSAVLGVVLAALSRKASRTTE